MSSAAPTTARVTAIHLCVLPRTPMQPVPAARAVADRGLDGDRHARKGSRRQLLLMDRETLDALGLSPGQVRENVTTEGIAVQALPAGARLRLGGALLELTGPCEPCSFMDSIRPGLQEESRGRRGVTARVVEGGEIRVGDPVVGPLTAPASG